MKTNLQFFAVLIGLICSMTIHAQTTVTDGNWSNPETWGGVPPTGSGNVVINHTVTLDIDYTHIANSITINASGALNGNSSMRLFTLNYPNGTATMTVNGSFNIARTFLVSNTVNNNGIFQSDSLLNSSDLTISPEATINTSQFMNNSEGTLNNNGTITSVDFLNIETVTNYGTITTNDFTNSKSFTNTSDGVLLITNDFSNIDTLASPAIFTNDGMVTVENNWHNGNQVNGSGRFCISNNTWNSGSMSGTFDFCDLTGGEVDLNTGTISETITYCLFSCLTEINELVDNSLISVFPNPAKTHITISSEATKTLTVEIFDLTGKLVTSAKIQTNEEFNISSLNSGVYLLKITDEKRISFTNKLIKQ